MLASAPMPSLAVSQITPVVMVCHRTPFTGAVAQLLREQDIATGENMALAIGPMILPRRRWEHQLESAATNDQREPAVTNGGDVENEYEVVI